MQINYYRLKTVALGTKGVEDLIGLKVQAMANDSTRTSVDLPDIEVLMDRYREELDWNTVQEYFALFEQQELFSTLKGKYHHAE